MVIDRSSFAAPYALSLNLNDCINEFSKGKGIIATREKFLKTKQGMEELAGPKNSNEKDALVATHYQ